MQVLRPQFCEHKKRMTIDDGEVICTKCGEVLGRDDHTTFSIESRTNLFLDIEIGSKPDYAISGTKYMHTNSQELMTISNISQAMDIPSFLNKDVWFWYCKLKSNLKMTKAKIIVLVFYQVCRANAFPLDENVLLVKVKFYLNVKNVHSSLHVISEANSFLDDGVLVIEKIGFTQLINHGIHFILSSKIKSLHGKYNNYVISKIATTSFHIASKMSGTDEQIAKKSFNLAKQRCGVC